MTTSEIPGLCRLRFDLHFRLAHQAYANALEA